MAKRKSRKVIPVKKRPDPGAELRNALTRQTKEELVSVLMELALEDRRVLRELTARFEVAPAPDELMAATRQAIADATDFDKREINRNFDYDFQAYEEVKRNLTRLVASGNLPVAMQLSLELMKDGSYQVEMSDEGMMTDDIEDCLSVVIQALKKCDLRSDEIIAWCSAMVGNDRVGFIAEEQLQALRNQFGGTKSKGNGATDD